MTPETAVEIVADWLGQNGWIGESIHNLNNLGIDVLKNIAPVAPEKTLEAIERAANGSDRGSFTSRGNSHHTEFVRLLRDLAYDPSLFDRSVELLCRYALSESKDENNNSTRDVLKSLFYIYLSGTHAPGSSKEPESLKDWWILKIRTSRSSGSFFSMPRWKHGILARLMSLALEPGRGITVMNQKHEKKSPAGLNTFIRIVTRLALSDQPIAEKARKLLADNLRGLWTKAGMFDALQEAARKIQAQKAWNDGWIAVRETLRYDGKDLTNEELRGKTSATRKTA